MLNQFYSDINIHNAISVSVLNLKEFLKTGKKMFCVLSKVPIFSSHEECRKRCADSLCE